MRSVIVVWCRLSFFFFSSRRRHTRFDCDWSSDVCSSDARRRLVEQEERRPREERVGDRELLLHAARERAGGPPGEGGEPRAREQLAGARAELPLHHPVEARREAQVLLHREIAVEAEGLGDVADARLERRHVAAQIVAEDGCLRGLDLEQPRQRAEERRLPGAVGPDDAHDLAPLEHEIDAGERAPGAVALLEAAQPDHGWRYTLPSVPGWRCSTFSSTRTLARYTWPMRSLRVSIFSGVKFA